MLYRVGNADLMIVFNLVRCTHGISGVVLLSANIKIETLSNFLVAMLTKLRDRARNVVDGTLQLVDWKPYPLTCTPTSGNSPIEGRETQQERNTIKDAYTRLLKGEWKPSHFMIDKSTQELQAILAGVTRA